MPGPEIPNPADPRKNDGDDKSQPGKPGSDPDQTPEREVNNPPVADPPRKDQPGKIGFSDYLLF